MKTLQIGVNKSGCRFALVASGDSYAVYRECLNYCRHVKGGIAKTWRYVNKDMSLELATSLFENKLQGRQKA